VHAVVTGGAGFVGSHLIEALVARGDRVIGIDRPQAPWRWIGELPVTRRDIGLDDVDALAAAIAGADVVFHLAALTEARTADEMFRVNVAGTEAVVRAAAHRPGTPPHLVFASSLAALGPCRNGDRLCAETAPHPLSTYGESKLRAEAVLHAWADRVPITALRFTTVYGPRERAVYTFFQMVARGVALTIGDWDREVQLIHVRDAVALLLAAADHPSLAMRTWCVSHPEVVTWGAIADVVGRTVGRAPLRLSVPVPMASVIARGAEAAAALQHRPAILNRERVREMTQRRWVCDPEPAFAALGVRPGVPMEAGIPVTYDWYRQAGWL
jgi:nucleoside-diphosphate-sugar epimerase